MNRPNFTHYDPAMYSNAENAFIIQSVGLPPRVAERDLPKDVNPKAVMPFLERCYELAQLKEHRGEVWAGPEAIKRAGQVWLEETAKWERDAKRGRPRWPTMFAYDSRGRAFRSGTGSDNYKVKTYFDPNGNRIPFALELIPTDRPDWAVGWSDSGQLPAGQTIDRSRDKIVTDTDNKRIECLICGHTVAFNPDSRNSYFSARARMSKHLRGATTDVERHREVHMAEFGQASTK